MKAVAYLNWGRWVADCPNPACTNAMQVEPGQAQFECTRPAGCGTTAPLAWPDDPAAVEAEVADLPESQRHWKPTPEFKEAE